MRLALFKGSGETEDKGGDSDGSCQREQSAEEGQIEP